MKPLLFSFMILLLLLPTSVMAGSSHPNDQYELSRNPSALDDEKTLSWSFSGEGGSLLLITVVPNVAPCSEQLLDFQGVEGDFDEAGLELYADWFSDEDFSYSIGLVELVTPSGAFDENHRVWDAAHDGPTGEFVCIVGMFMVLTENSEDIHLTIIKIYANWVDKALAGVQDQATSPFSGSNLYITLCIGALVIGVAVLIYKKKK